MAISLQDKERQQQQQKKKNNRLIRKLKGILNNGAIL